MVRSAETLRRDQAAILESYREELSPPLPLAERAGSVLPTVAVVYGRVSSVVTTDPTYGPHLMVVRQVWSGVPPTVSDGDAVAVRCYPTPNHVVGDYSVNDYVRVVSARGALLAELPA